jgi:late competence protein required for DNA uptake (superfamily II DNA/RNA helicase)
VPSALRKAPSGFYSFSLPPTLLLLASTVPLKKEAVKFPSLAQFQSALLKRLQNNTKIIVFWGSKRKGTQFEQVLKEQLPNKKVKFYHADSDDALDNDLNKLLLLYGILTWTVDATVGA